MIGNKQAYEAAYRRGLEGRSSRGLLDLLTAPFEDHYTRMSREQGHRDGRTAREGQPAQPGGAPAAQ